MMSRQSVLMIRLSDQERQIIHALAMAEKLPVSTFARRKLLFEAELRGLVPRQGQKHNHAGEGLVPTPSAIAAE